jgi:hypothetical protein
MNNIAGQDDEAGILEMDEVTESIGSVTGRG